MCQIVEFQVKTQELVNFHTGKLMEAVASHYMLPKNKQHAFSCFNIYFAALPCMHIKLTMLMMFQHFKHITASR